MCARLASDAVAAHETHHAEVEMGDEVDGEMHNDDRPELI
jgi:hypothetical protein